MGKLVIIPTPIGNLDDITFRAVKMLNECQLVYAEDTRVTKKLLNHLNIQNHVVPFHTHNEHRVLEKCIESIKSNELTGLVSDAGTPGISDPGYLLIRACLKEEIEVECLPGPTAIVPALVASTTSIPALRIIVPFLTAITGITSDAANAEPLSDNAVAMFSSV